MYLALLPHISRLALGVQGGCILQHPLSSIVAAIEQDVLYHLQELLIHLLICICLDLNCHVNQWQP